MKRLFLIIVAFCFAFAANAQTITCMVCRGSGALICPACGGAGMTYSVFGFVPCYICGGTRFIPCSICHGKGSVTYVAPPAQSLNGNPFGGSYGSPYGGSFDNSSSSSSSSSTTIQKKCPYCNGTGETIQHESVATFGLDGPKTYCAKCNQSWSYGTVHAHHTCGHCNGTGYNTY